MKIIEVRDQQGRNIRLSLEQWNHILLHKSMLDQLENIRSTIEFPEATRQSLVDDNVIYYYKKFRDASTKSKYLLVAVKYLNGEGFIITAFYTNKIKGKLR